jgi:hypothetical protein
MIPLGSLPFSVIEPHTASTLPFGFHLTPLMNMPVSSKNGFESDNLRMSCMRPH